MTHPKLSNTKNVLLLHGLFVQIFFLGDMGLKTLRVHASKMRSLTQALQASQDEGLLTIIAKSAMRAPEKTNLQAEGMLFTVRNEHWNTFLSIVTSKTRVWAIGIAIMESTICF